MYAIVEIKGKQYKVEEGKFYDVDLCEDEVGTELNFDKVLLASDGEKVNIGKPAIEGASVKAKVLKHDKQKKILVFKYKRKKGYRRKQGHRQNFTRVQIEKIEAKVA